MSDINVTISEFPLQVNVNDTPINVYIDTPGVAGPKGDRGDDGSSGTGSFSSIAGITGVSITGGLGFTGYFNLLAGTNVTLTQQGTNTLSISATAGSSNLNGLISTGSADLRYILTGASGQFYPVSNPEHYLKSGEATNANISGLISTGNADLRYLVTGASGSFYSTSNPNNFIRSGDFSLNGLISTGSADLRYLFSGSSGAFYASSNPNQFIKSGDVDTKLNGLISTGSADLRYLQTGASGQFYLNSNPNNFIRSGDVNAISGSISERLSQTGTNLIALFSASSAGVSSLNALSGILNLVGQGNITITTGAGTITISGNTGFLGGYYTNSNPLNFSSSGNVESTGTSLQNQVNTERNKNTVTGISISGGISITGSLNINAGANITLTQVGNNSFSIASAAGGGGSTNITGLISTGDADLRYLATGSSIGFLTTGYNVASINDLKNIQVTGLANNTIVYVRSYYADYTDRGLGGGQFVWKSSSTSAEDSGRYLSSNSSPSLGRWERLLNGQTPNVMMWGARGDATANGRFFTAGSNDTPSIQKALDAARYGWNSELHFPAATYKITGTLYWDAQQVKIIGDGCVNGTRLWMETGVRQDILVSYGAKAIFDHNANPATGTDPAVISITNDIPKIEGMQIGYAGHYAENLVTSNEPLQNSTNSCLVFTLPGETNGIYNISTDGGSYGIRIIGPQGPGLKIINSTINSQGDAAISVEAPIYKTWNGSAFVLATGAGGGMVTLDNCSSDYRGSFYTGYSFIKVQSGAAPNIYIKDLKLEGEYSSGVVNYQRPNSYNSKLGSIKMDGIFWNVTQTHGIEQNLIVVHPADNTVVHSVNTSIKNCQFVGIDNVIKDYIAVGESGLPFIYTPDRDTALSQQNFIPEINYQATRLNGLANDPNWYSSLALYKNDQIQIKFTPTRTGWWRIARGIGNASNLLNHDLSISHYYGVSKLKLIADNKYPKSCEIFSDSIVTNTDYIPVTRARFFHNTSPWSGTSDYPLFLDIFVNKLVTGNGFDDSMKRIIIHSPQLGIGLNSEEEYTHILNPVFVSGTENVTYGAASNPYCEVDLTRKQDRGNSFQTNYGNTLLVNKDFHAFLDSNRNLRFFDAGVRVSFNGGGGFAAGDAVIVNGEIKHIILTDTGNNYTSPPTISITPNTSGNGTGAFASGTFSLNGGLQRIVILSGGAGYGLPPLGDSYGYTYLQTGTSGGFYPVSNPNQFIRSGDISSQYLSTGASGNFVTLNTTQVIKSAKTLSGVNNATDFNFYGSSNQSNSNPIVSVFGVTGNSTYSKVVSLGQSGLVLHGQKDSNYYSNVYNSTDVLNGGIDALYISPTSDASNRLFLGSPGKTWYAVDFTYVTNLASIAVMDVTSRLGHTYGRYIGGEAGQQNHWQSYYGWAIKPNMAANYSNSYSIVGNGLDDFGLIIVGQNPATKQFVVRAASGQSTNLIEWQGFTGNSFAVINPSGWVGLGNINPISLLDISGHAYASGGKLLTATDSGNLQTLLTNLINGLSGQLNITGGVLYLKSNPNNFISSGDVALRNSVTGISVTGSNGITGFINIVGIYGTNVILSGSNTIGISGGGGGGSTNITNNYSINSGSGIFIYRSLVTSGVNQQFFNFPTLLDARPIVLATLHNDNFNTLLNFQVSGANPTGFYGLFSATTSNTGYYLDIFASNSQQTGMATNIILNNIVNSGFTGWFSKSVYIENPQPNDDITLFYTQNSIQVQRVKSVIRGAGLGSGLFSIRYSSDRTAAGTELLTNYFSVTGRGTGNDFISFSNAVIPGNNWVWKKMIATGETLSGIATTIFYTNLS